MAEKQKTRSLIDERSAAARLGLERQTLANWRFQGRGLPYVKLGRSVRYDPDAIEKFCRQNTINPEGE